MNTAQKKINVIKFTVITHLISKANISAVTTYLLILYNSYIKIILAHKAKSSHFVNIGSKGVAILK